MIWWILIFALYFMAFIIIKKDGLDDEGSFCLVVASLILFCIIVNYTWLNDTQQERDLLIKTYRESLEHKTISELYTLEKDVLEANQRIADHNEEHIVFDALFFLKEKVKLISIEEITN